MRRNIFAVIFLITMLAALLLSGCGSNDDYNNTSVLVGRWRESGGPSPTTIEFFGDGTGIVQSEHPNRDINRTMVHYFCWSADGGRLILEVSEERAIWHHFPSLRNDYQGQSFSIDYSYSYSQLIIFDRTIINYEDGRTGWGVSFGGTAHREWVLIRLGS